MYNQGSLGYIGTFLTVFLTHPGVIIPVDGAMSSGPGGLSLGSLPPVWSGLWQCLWVWILGLPGEKPASGWTMITLYLIFLGLYAYFFLGKRMG
jgi:hypothetical protein